MLLKRNRPDNRPIGEALADDAFECNLCALGIVDFGRRTGCAPSSPI
jgi:hypothetical protein